MIDNQPEQNQNKKNQKTEDFLNPENIESLGKIAHIFFENWKNFQTEKVKKIYTFNIVSRFLNVGFLMIIFVVLSILAYNHTITETIFATLISSIIGFLVGSNRNSSDGK